MMDKGIRDVKMTLFGRYYGINTVSQRCSHARLTPYARGE